MDGHRLATTLQRVVGKREPTVEEETSFLDSVQDFE